MSWQEYVDNNLVGTAKIARAAIMGQKGGVWASSPGYKLSAQEQAAIISAHNNLDTVQANGIRLNNQKFFTLSADSRSVYGKQGAAGCLLVKSVQAIIIAEYVPPVQHAEATTVVEGLADYLIAAGF